jgi:phage nucleotide-binding protein
MQIYNTADPQNMPKVFMLLYGHGGTGKTTFASTAPKPILADCEGGAKYFGIRGISMPKADILNWDDMRAFFAAVKNNDEYETIIIDPVGELMEKLMRKMKEEKNAKLIQADGSPTMTGWGWLKDNMRNMLKALRDTNKHIIIIAHVDEKEDEGRLVKRPMIMTKLSDELVNMVDIVGFATKITGDEGDKYAILVDTQSDKYIAKDRTGQLGKAIEPNFSKIIKAIHGTETYTWSKKKTEPVKKVPAKPKESKKSEIDSLLNEVA